MKHFLLGMLVGAALLGAVWGVVWAWPHVTTSDWEKIVNVVRGTIERRLHGAVFLDVAQWRDVPPSGSSPMRPRMIEATVIYERHRKVKRITFPIFVEDGAWTTPRADVLERLDLDADIAVDKTRKRESNK